MEYTIDATNKSLGRLASEVAVLLMGKNDPSFVRNSVADTKVVVQNASKLTIAPEKMLEKVYTTYSGYPGGLKEATLAHVIEKKGYKEAVTIAVKGMLPDNKLKKLFLQHLTVNE